jgi:hypothetical protein
MLDPLFQDLQQKIRRVVLLLSGYEQSRLSGIASLPSLLKDAEVTIAGPQPGPQAMLERYLSPPFFQGGFASWVKGFQGAVAFHTLRPGIQRIDGERVEVEAITGEESRALLRVRDVVFVGGTAHSLNGGEAILKDAALLIVDAGEREKDGDSTGHKKAKAAARIALGAKVKDLMLSGLLPNEDRASLDGLLFESSFVFPRSIVASDMMFFRLQGVSDEDDAGTASTPSRDAPEENLDPTSAHSVGISSDE